MRRINWLLWGGFVLAIVAFFSYFGVLSQIPATRDVPWPSFLLFAIAVVLLIAGWRRAPRKVGASIVALIGLLVTGVFTYLVTVGSKGLPVSSGAPAVGEKAPAFTLPDAQNRPVALNDLLSGSKGALVVFYRGYWCPFCNSELRSIQKHLPEFERLGIRVIAISADPPATLAGFARKAGYTFPLLSDQNTAVIRQYDLLHKGGGMGDLDIARPAEFLIDGTGTVRWRDLTDDYRVRARVETMLAEAAKLK